MAGSMQEFAKMHAIMQQANSDTLAAFYAGSVLTYESSMGMRVAADLFGKATKKVRGKIDQSDTSISPKLERLLTRIVAKVAKAESQYVIDSLGAYAASQVAAQIKDQISGAALKGIPVVGLIKAGVDALLADASAIDLVVRRAAAARHATELKVGPPREAALAVKKILTRKAAIESAAAASSSAAFGAGVAIEVGSMGYASAAGLETGVAISQAIIEVIAMVVEMVMDSLECHRGNEILANHADVANYGPQTLQDMFNKCPLLGGYMLATTIVPTSAFVWLITKDYNIASVEEVSRVAVKHVNPLRTEGSWVVCKSPFELRNPTNETSDKAMRESRLRNEANKSIADKLLDSLVQNSYETPEAYKGFGMDNGTKIEAHTISRKAGILNKPATRFLQFKKTTSQKIASTRVGAYLKKLS